MNREPEPRRKPEPGPEESPAPTAPTARDFLQRSSGVSRAERERLLDAEREARSEVQRLQERIGIYESLVRSARSLSSILDLEELLVAILREVVGLARVDRGFLLLADDQGVLRINSGYDAKEGTIEPASDAAISRTLATEAFAENRRRTMDDREKYRWQESIQSLQLQTIDCIPLRTRKGPIGVLYLDSKRPDSLPHLAEGAILEAYSAHAAVAIENARLHQQVVEARRGLERENRDLRRALPGARGVAEILGQSRAIEEMRHRIGQLQEVDSPVLILGESGVGKDLVARAIHAGSQRSARQMMVIECTSVPRDLMESELFGHRRGAFTGALQDKQGLLEAADGGTLFLNEIGDLPGALQGKLLQALEYQEFRRVGETTTRKVDVRILSATNRDLEEMIARGTFREDLYYRLKVATLPVPPLRARSEDILLLAEHFLRQNLEKRARPYSGFTPAGVGFLLSYPWPGNVRELKNAIEGACIYLQPGEPIDAEDLQLVANRERVLAMPAAAARSETGLKEYRQDAERQLLEEALVRTGWVVSKAARLLGISRQHLHSRIKRYDLLRPGATRDPSRQPPPGDEDRNGRATV